MKTRKTRLMALWIAALSASVMLPACEKQESTPAEKAAAEKAAAEKALADKAATDNAVAAGASAAADKALADKAASDKAAADLAAKHEADTKAAVDKALADKAAADKAAADKAAADLAAQTAAAKIAADEKAQAAALPSDLVLMKSELSQALSQIDITTAKLEALSVSPDVKEQSKDVIASIDALDKTTQDIKKRATDMRDRGASYFEAWEKQLSAMSTPEVAEIAAKRKEELSAQYADVLTSMQETRAAFEPFWTELQSVRQTVYNGLTPETQKALVGQAKSLKDMATTLRGRVEATSAKLNQVSGIYVGK